MIYARILIICSLGFFSQKKTTWAIKKIVLKLVFTATRNDGMENNLSQGLLLGQVCFQINYFSLLHVLSFASLIFFSTNLWSPAFSRFSRRFPINLSVGCTGDNKTWFTETGRCSHLWRETQTDRLRFACKVLQLLLLIFFRLWGKKKKGHKYCCVCVCCLICCVRFYGGWRKNAVPSWHFVSSRRCFGQNRRARIVRQYWFRLFSYFFFPSFCLFLLRVKVWVSSRVQEEATFRRPGWKNCDIRHSK